MVVLAELFRVSGKLSATQLTSLKAWFWKTTLTGYFSGWNSGQMNSDLQAVRSFAEGETRALDLGPVPFSRSIWISRQFRLNNAHAKMLGLMLAHNRPRDLVNGQLVALDRALSWSNAREYHHFFPNAFLKAQDVEVTKRNCIANFVLLTSASNKEILDDPPSVYIPKLREKLGDQFDDVMRSNLLSPEAIEAASKDDFATFLQERSDTLHKYALGLSGIT